MIYPIVAYGDPVLKKMALDIVREEFDPALVNDMFETMYNAGGIGLAAPQIGKSVRLFVVDAGALEEEEDAVGFKSAFINPTILEEFGEDWGYEEGCLSIPGIRGEVVRPSKLRIHYFDENWVEHTAEFDGMIARIIQHEYDHIEGILFVEHLSSLRRQLLKTKLTNISRGDVDARYRMKFRR